MPLRLKSLELHGYKTFASRTLFEFAPKVTAIVGPNGSGKSNIADSLRWVLGEQSYALLRGKKTEDMIFSGSEHRARAGMASATITFDNCDGWLPIDFTEVAITRRAYRDGQNEYLINGQRMRLKDVSELLAQSGLAERTYTIIGQGLVDAALALKAEERRRLFEEAAGIGLHRTRREDALRRLEITHRNLDRVQDILAELQPRLRSLERQARRAQEYEQIKADLRVVLRDWYGYHWHHEQEELRVARDSARRQETILERARQEQAALDEQLSALRERIQGLRASLNSWHRQSAQFHSQREALSLELAIADERTRSLSDQQQNIRQELARMEEEVGLNKERLSGADGEVERLTGELQEARQQVEVARQALAVRQAERLQLERNLEAARKQLSALNARQSQLQFRLSERHGQIQQGQKALEKAQSEVSQAEQTLAEVQARLEAVQRGHTEAEANYKQAEARFQAQNGRLVEVESARKEALEQRSTQTAELARLKAQAEVLDQAEAALTGYGSGTRLLLQAARQARLPGTSGALSSRLEVPVELETAIAAALGEFLDAVLLDLEPERALNILENQAARGVLLPLQLLKPATPLSLEVMPVGKDELSQAGVIGVAADLIGAPPKLRPAVDLLLGQVVVVRDRLAAKRLLSVLNWDADGASFKHGKSTFAQVRAVTLKGEVFLSSGPILTGSGGSSSSGQSVLSRQRQRRELGIKLDQAAKQVEVINANLVELDSDLKTCQGEVERAMQAERRERQRLEHAAQATNQARLALDQARQQVTWRVEQHARLQADISRKMAEVERISTDRAVLENELTQARDGLRSQNNALAALALEEFQAQVAYWNTQVAVAERAVVNEKSRQRDQQAALQRAERSLNTAHMRLEELGQARQALETEKVTQRQVEGEIGEKIEALRILIEPAESELEDLEAKQAALQTAETTARQTMSMAEHLYAQTKITLARRQEALEGLRRRIEDDFGLVAFEYADQVSGPMTLPLEGMVEQLPSINQLGPEVEESINRQRTQLRRMGAINPEAQAEYLEVKTRYEFLTSQVADLKAAEENVRQVIAELDELMQREFHKTFDAVAAEFREIFTRLFGGGSARLILTDPDDLTNTGIDIEARLPGRRTQGLSLLSGGERSLTATALVFALLKVSPTPFCVLDEVDAMLDEANVGRFRELLRELSQNTQFVVVTHNRNTVQVADVLYGVTMGRDSASQVLSLQFDEVAQIVE